MKKIKIVMMFVCLQVMMASRAMEHPYQSVEDQKAEVKERLLDCYRQMATPASSDDRERHNGFGLYEEALIHKMAYDSLVRQGANQELAQKPEQEVIQKQEQPTVTQPIATCTFVRKMGFSLVVAAVSFRFYLLFYGDSSQ